jgi:hypothetical protein
MEKNMNLSRETITILKNFATINSNIVIDAGNVIKTISEAKNIFAKSQVDETFPVQFGIYDLQEFLSVVALFDKPQLDFSETSVLIHEGRRKVNYQFSSPEILTYPSKDIVMPSNDVQFTLSADQLLNLQRAANTLSVTDIVITAGDSGAIVSVCDLDNPTSNSYEIEFEGIEIPEEAKLVFNISNLKVIPDNYEVSVSSKFVSEFVGSNATYYIALEKSSAF